MKGVVNGVMKGGYEGGCEGELCRRGCAGGGCEGRREEEGGLGGERRERRWFGERFGERWGDGRVGRRGLVGGLGGGEGETDTPTDALLVWELGRAGAVRWFGEVVSGKRKEEEKGEVGLGEEETGNRHTHGRIDGLWCWGGRWLFGGLGEMAN